MFDSHPRPPLNSALQKRRIGQPAFLRRLHNSSSRLDARPAWLNWNVASMLVAISIFGVLLWFLSPILAPFLAALILAYIFDPIVTRLQSKGLPRSAGTAIAILVLLLTLALLLLIVLPLFGKEFRQLTEQFPGFIETLRTNVIPWINQKLGVEISLDPSSFRQFVTDNLGDASGVAKRIVASIGVGGLAVVGVLINALLIPVVLFYVLRDWPQLIAHTGNFIPRRIFPTVRGIVTEIDAVLSEFLRGQISVMLLMSVFYVTGLWLAGLSFALPVGLITGLLVFVPYLGAGTGLLLGTVAAIMQFPSINGVIAVWVVFGAGQLLEGFLVTPWLVGNRIGLHPVAVIFALLAFGQIFGFFGVLLALPASAAILVGLRHLNGRYKESRLYQR